MVMEETDSLINPCNLLFLIMEKLDLMENIVIWKLPLLIVVVTGSWKSMFSIQDKLKNNFCRLAKNELYHGQNVSSAVPTPSKLSFDLSSSSVVSIQKATQQFDVLAGKHEIRVVTFEGYGKSLIKKFGVSPDAFAQMAIQLAYYKMYGVSRATYESSGTRKFKDGRTETGRSVSVESVAWVKAMQDPTISVCFNFMKSKRLIFRLSKRESWVVLLLLPNQHICMQQETEKGSIDISWDFDYY